MDRHCGTGTGQRYSYRSTGGCYYEVYFLSSVCTLTHYLFPGSAILQANVNISHAGCIETAVCMPHGWSKCQSSLPPILSGNIQCWVLLYLSMICITLRSRKSVYMVRKSYSCPYHHG